MGQKTIINAGNAFCSLPAFIIGLLVLFGCMQTSWVARLHGDWLPVMTQVQVTSVEPYDMPTGQPGSKLSGYVTVNRLCDRGSISWQVNGPTGSAAITVADGDAPETPHLGRKEWSAILVGIAPDRLAETTGYIHHRCGGFPVTTDFFRPDGQQSPIVAPMDIKAES